MKEICLGKNLGDNIDLKKYGFTLYYSGGDFGYEIWYKKSVSRMGNVVNIWKSAALIDIVLFEKNRDDIKKTTICTGYAVDNQRQLYFLLRNNTKISQHIFKNRMTFTLGKSKQDNGSPVGGCSISWGIIDDNGCEILMRTSEGGKEVYRNPDFDALNKKHQKKMVIVKKNQLLEKKEWDNTPAEEDYLLNKSD